MAEHETANELEALRADVAKLRADLAGLAEAFKGAGQGRAEEAKATLADLAETLREELRQGLAAVRDRGKKSVETVEQQIGERPFLTLLAAFSIGVILGKLFDRR